MVIDHWDEYPTQGLAIHSIAAKMGMSRETLRKWVDQAERDRGLRPGPTPSESTRLKKLEREVRELLTGVASGNGK